MFSGVRLLVGKKYYGGGGASKHPLTPAMLWQYLDLLERYELKAIVYSYALLFHIMLQSYSLKCQTLLGHTAGTIYNIVVTN